MESRGKFCNLRNISGASWNGFELLVRRRPDLWKQQEFKWIWKDASYTFNINHAPDVSFDDCLAKPQNRCILMITVLYLSPILTYLAWVLSFSATLYFLSATFWRQMYFFTSLHLSEQLLTIVINSDYVLHQSQMSACVWLTYFFNNIMKTNYIKQTLTPLIRKMPNIRSDNWLSRQSIAFAFDI